MRKMLKYSKIKRVLDLIIATLLLIICFPLMLGIAVLIKIDSRGPVIFKQKRVGKNNKIFTLYKFRTMIMETEKNGRKLSDKERLTKVGKIIREFSLDELPQLINIIKGDMSFIGPRPLLVEYLEYYDDFQKRRHEVLPGITGWAQVNGRNATTWEKRFEYDVWYVDNMSFWLDLKIFLLTIKNIILKEGIYYSQDETMPLFSEYKKSKIIAKQHSNME